MNNKLDLRIIKTKKSIYEALIKIMETKSFDEIKVSEICEVALVNRSTFYSHFDDKYVLLESMINDFENQFKDELKQLGNFKTKKEYYMSVLQLLFNHLENDTTNYAAVLMYNRNNIFVDVLYRSLKDSVMEQLNDVNSLDIPSDFISSFYIGAIINVCSDWIRNKNKYTKEDIINYIEKLFI